MGQAVTKGELGSAEQPVVRRKVLLHITPLPIAPFTPNHSAPSNELVRHLLWPAQSLSHVALFDCLREVPHRRDCPPSVSRPLSWALERDIHCACIECQVLTHVKVNSFPIPVVA